MENSALELEKLRHEADRFRQSMELIKYVLSCVTFAGSLWLIFEGIAKIIARQDPAGIIALAKVLESIHIGSVLGYLFGFAGIAAWKAERAGKKRAIREKNKFQKLAEQRHPNRSGSGLDEVGHTPKEADDE